MNKTIYQLLSDYQKEEIDFIISKLNNHDKYLIYLRYGRDLENPNFSNWKQDYNYEFYAKLLSKMKRCLKAKQEGKTIITGGKTIKTIYQKLSDYQKEDIDYVVSLLSDEDRQILYLRYGRDLENPDVSNWNPKLSHEFSYIIQKIEIRLKNLQGEEYVFFKINGISTIYQILNNYTKNEIDFVIENLSLEDKYLLWLRYGNDLENPVKNSNWKRKDSINFYKKLLPKIRRKLEHNRKVLKGEKETHRIKTNNPYLLNIVKETLEKLKMESYSILLQKYSIEEILSYVLIQRIDNNYNAEDISRYFGLDIKTVISMANKVLSDMIKNEETKVLRKTNKN